MTSSNSDKMEAKSVDDRQRESEEWLSTLDEPELDFLISLKELVIRRAKNVGYKDWDNKFDLRMLRALGFILLEHFKERVQSTSEFPDSGEIWGLLSKGGLSTLNSGTESSDRGTPDLSFLTPRRKQAWDSLCEEGTANLCKRQKTSVTDD